MKYKVKLFIAAISVSTVSSILALGTVEFLTRNYLFQFLRNNVASVAGTTANLIDGEMVKRVLLKPDVNSEDYKTLVHALRNARNVNRRTDIYIKFLYITYPDPKDFTKFFFLVDGEESPKDYSPPGSEDPGSSKNQVYENLNEIFAAKELTNDPWGTWLTGYAPIHDRAGNYVASIGADMSASFVNKKLNRLYLFAFIAFMLSLLEAIVVVIFHANKVTRALMLLENATGEVRKGNFKFRLKLDSNDEFEDLGNMMNTMNEWLEENEKVKRGFTHYLSQNALQKLVQEEKRWHLEGQKRKITVLYCSIRDFHVLAKNFTPQEVVQFLNQYFKIVLEIIFKHNGMLDKLIEDSVIAEFGMPIEDPEQETHAVLAGLEMQQAIHSLEQYWREKTSSQFEIQIGIHTGETILGSIDSEGKVQYTSIGNTVQVASKIVDTIKKGKYPLVVSETTLKGLPSYFISEEVESLQIEETMRLYRILSKENVLK